MTGGASWCARGHLVPSLSWCSARGSCTALTVPAGAGLCIMVDIGRRASAGIVAGMLAQSAAANDRVTGKFGVQEAKRTTAPRSM